MAKFRVGDCVEAVKDHISDSRSILKGDIGTVCCADDIDVGVEWEKKIDAGHSCSGHCKYGYGWYVYPREIILHEDETEDIDEDSFIAIAFRKE